MRQGDRGRGRIRRLSVGGADKAVGLGACASLQYDACGTEQALPRPWHPPSLEPADSPSLARPTVYPRLNTPPLARG
jgi:hypothetical protein